MSWSWRLLMRSLSRPGVQVGRDINVPPPLALLRLNEAIFLLTHGLHLWVSRVTRPPAKLHGWPLAGASLQRGKEEDTCKGQKHILSTLSMTLPSHRPLQHAFKWPLLMKSPCKCTQIRVWGFRIQNSHVHVLPQTFPRPFLSSTYKTRPLNERTLQE